MKNRKLSVRIKALFLAVVMMFTLAASAFASWESGKTTIYGGNSKVAVINTGKGTRGWPNYSPVYVQNKGSKAIYVWGATTSRYAYVNGAVVQPGSCRTFYLNNNKTYYITIQASNGNSSVNVFASRDTTRGYWG